MNCELIVPILILVILIGLFCYCCNIERFESAITKPKILSISCYGYGNIGDNMYSEVFKHYLQSEADVIKLRDNHMYVDSKGVLNKHRPNTDWDFDYLLLGGGGVINNNKLKNSDNLKYYTNKAMATNKPIIIISCGIQSNSEFDDDWKKIWNYASLITVRSPTDKQIILKNTPSANVKYQRDLGYLIAHCGKYNFVKQGNNRLTIVVSGPVNPTNNALKEIVKKTKPKEIVVMNTGARYDESMKEWIDVFNFPDIKTIKLYGQSEAKEFGNINNESDLNVFKTLNVINNSSLVLSGRYHGMVFARSLGIPCDTMGMDTNKILNELPNNSIENMVDSSYENIKLLKQTLGLRDTSKHDIKVIYESINNY